MGANNLELAIGVHRTPAGAEIETLDVSTGITGILSAKQLATRGLPSKKGARVRFQGELGSFEVGEFASYSQGLDLPLPDAVTIRHQAFRAVGEDGMEFMVPALALMRAFFWPCDEVLPAVFTSRNVGRFALINYRDDLPVVSIEEGLRYFQRADFAAGNDRHIKWLHTSKSARSCAQSVELWALQGWLGLDLPKGHFDLVLSGPLKDGVLYATSAEVNSVAVEADDNLTKQAEMVYLHRAPRSEASRRTERIDVNLSEDESAALLRTALAMGYSIRPELLRLMLSRMKQGFWDRAEPGVVLKAGQALRTLEVDGVMDAMLDRLQAIRSGTFNKPKRSGPATRQTSDAAGQAVLKPGERVAKLFLDTEFLDEPDSLRLVSIGLVASSSQFYGERDLSVSPLPTKMGKFIETSVLPQLGKGADARGGMFDVAKGLAAWLNNLGAQRVEVHYDFSGDFTLLEGLLALVPEQLQVAAVPVHIGYLLEDPAGEKAAQQCWAEVEAARGLKRHHALADALALKARFEAVHGPESAQQ